MAVNVKMGVDLSGFKSGIQQGTQILKGLNSEMKAAEAEFKATGNAEQLMANKTKTLNSQIQVQKGIVDQAKTALQQMTDAGVDPADKAYQSMYATMMKAQAGMYEAQAALNGLNTSAQEAATGADKLTNSVNSIGKKISLDQVINGIGSITGALENAAAKAVQLGTQLWNSIMDSAAWSDDIGTLADKLGLTVEQVQQMRVIAAEFEAPVEEIGKTWKKVKMNMTSDSDDVAKAFNKVGVATRELVGDEGEGVYKYRDYLDVFWETGEALMNMTDEAERERLAQTLLGKSWDEMTTLFKKGRKAYEDAMDSVETVDDETIENNAALADSVAALEEQFNIFKASVLGNISPELTKVTESFSGLLGAITEYANSPEGKELLGKIGEAVGSLIDDISNINPQEVVSGFVSVIDGLVSGLQWIVDNQETLKNALIAVVGAWGAMEIGEGVLTILKIVNGLSGLTGGASGEIAAAGAAAGASWGGAFAAAALAAAPWLLALLAKDLIPEENQIDNEKRVESADASKEEVQRLKEWVEVQNKVLQMEDKMFTDDFDEAEYEKLAVRASELGNPVQQGDLWSKYWDYIVANDLLRGGNMPTDVLDKMLESITGGNSEDGVPIKVDPQPPGDTPEKIKEEVGVVSLDAQLVVTGITAGGTMSLTVGGMPSGGGGGGLVRSMLGYANGLPYVPSDGLYRLHRGEKVVTAREAGRSFSSNLYVENMNMSGGLSADALAASIAARNQRLMSGYGS